MKPIFILSLLLITALGSCRYFSGERIRGNGITRTETRATGPFSNIEVSGAIDVYARQDSVPSVKVETDENLLAYVDIFTEGNTLVVKPKKGFNLRPTNAVKVYVGSAALENFYASGACNIYGESKISSNGKITIKLSGASEVKMEVNAPATEVDATGAGTIVLKGETKDFRVDGSGSTEIRCFDLMAENTSIHLSGAGDAEVFASVKLDVRVSGAADVKYKGNATVDQEISGAGSVKKAE